MKILVVDNETKHLEELLVLLQDYKVDVISMGDEIDMVGYDLYILTGSSHHSIFHRPSPYAGEIDLIKNSNKPIIGICLGAQLIAQIYESNISKLPEKLENELHINYKNTLYIVKEAHRFVIKELGINLISLGSSWAGYEVIKHSNKPIRGLQFHPEIIDNNNGREIFYDILREIKI